MHQHEGQIVHVIYRPENSKIYIGVKTSTSLEEFLKLFRRLAEGSAREIRLEEESYIGLENLQRMTLRVSGENEGLRIEEREGASECDWVCSAANWELAVEMLKALADRGGAAHQYLPPDLETDDAEVEFDYSGPPIGNRVL